jgi:aspartate carbamoyltransferase catalytic subunit
MPGLLSAAQLSRSQIEGTLRLAQELHHRRPMVIATGKVVGLVFFQESLRTRIGYEVAAHRAGCAAVTVSAPKDAAYMGAPESLEDTLRSLEPNCDVICLRHADESAPQRATASVRTPIVNCGNGFDEHPSQALIDLLAIEEAFGTVDGLRIAIVGDLAQMRAGHSLILALARFERVLVRCISPPTARLPKRFAEPFEASGNTLETADSLDLDDIDLVYIAGLPRTPENGVTLGDQDRLRITRSVAANLPSATRIFCPLPRVDEIEDDVDALEQAAYWRQNNLATPVRTAVLMQALGDRTKG